MSRFKFTRLFICLVTSVLIVAPVASAQIMLERDGYASFYSEAPLEDIQAENTDVSAVLYTGSGSVLFKIPIKSFEFPNKLMQEHFNENYMESNKYPGGCVSGRCEFEIRRPEQTWPV